MQRHEWTLDELFREMQRGIIVGNRIKKERYLAVNAIQKINQTKE